MSIISYTDPNTGERIERPMTPWELEMWTEDQKSHMQRRLHELFPNMISEVSVDVSCKTDERFYSHRHTGEGTYWLPSLSHLPPPLHDFRDIIGEMV